MSSENPFPGPVPYRAADRARFFARDVAVKKLANHVMAYPATTIFGPSGAGKSSLMQAGVIPNLEDSDGMRVVRVDAWPMDKSPLRRLVNQMFVDFGIEKAPNENAPVALKKAISLALRHSDRPLLIYLDQIEQLFIAQRSEAEMNALLRGLRWLVRLDLQRDLHVVLSLREDYVGRLRDWTREFSALSAHGFRVTPLSVGEMVKAMCRTALEGEPPQHWDESNLRRLMLDVRMPGQRATDAADVQTAFAQIVCRALWEERATGQTAELDHADAEVILHHYLDATLEGLGEFRELAQRLLEEQLIDPDGHRTLLTEKQAIALVGNRAHDVLLRLEKAAILRAEEHQGSRYFELGHDWLAKKVLEGRRRRDEARQLSELEKERAARKRFEELEAVARQERDAAVEAQKEAIRATLMAGARELLASGQSNLAAVVLASIDKPERVRGWRQLAVDLMLALQRRSKSDPLANKIRIHSWRSSEGGGGALWIHWRTAIACDRRAPMRSVVRTLLRNW